MDQIASLSASQITRAINNRELSPVEVVEALLARIEEINPSLNAIITLSADLRQQASEAEAAVLRGETLGPLHGLPITIKDTIETTGLRSTSGSALRAHIVPDEDAPAVARLKAAGAMVLGKTNVAEMAMDYTADNPLFGRTNNPYRSSHTPGGSSGGEAAAIAAGLSFAGLGSDLAGSIRIPSHFCGIAGLKPTTGRVPGGGQCPPSFGPYSLGAVIGPMARCVEDLELLFAVLAEEPQAAPEGLRRQRAAWYADDGIAPVTGETQVALKNAAMALADAGLIIEETRPPGIERSHELWLKIFSRASVVQLRNFYRGHESKGGSFVRWRLSTADNTPVPTLDEYIQSWMERDQLRAALLKWMRDVPLLIAPVGAVPAPPHDTIKVEIGGTRLNIFRAFSYSQAFNVFDLPSVVVPAGRSADGLPIGVQIVGRPFAEKTVLAAAAIVEQALSHTL